MCIRDRSCPKAVEEFGWTLSKPYALKVFDMRVQAKATFADYAGVLKMMTASGQAAKMLLTCCTTEEFEVVAKSKCEMVLLELLKSAVKYRKNRHKAFGDDVDLVASIDTFAKYVHEDWFIPKALQYSVELVRDLVCLLYTSPSPRDLSTSRMPSSA